MTDEGRDRWAQWLLERRHGGDPERQKEVASYLSAIRDLVLDRAEIVASDTVLDVGCGDGLIGFGALDVVGDAACQVARPFDVELRPSDLRG